MADLIEMDQKKKQKTIRGGTERQVFTPFINGSHILCTDTLLVICGRSAPSAKSPGRMVGDVKAFGQFTGKLN